jgi:hypothetical protein
MAHGSTSLRDAVTGNQSHSTVRGVETKLQGMKSGEREGPSGHYFLNPGKRQQKPGADL